MDKTESAISYLEKVRGIEPHRIQIYNYGRQINALDLDGVVQSFYPTTGTIVIHRSNRWQNFPGKNSLSLPEAGVAEFGRLLQVPDAIKILFQMEEAKCKSLEANRSNRSRA